MKYLESMRAGDPARSKAMKKARARYGRMLWNEMARMRTEEERNALIRRCGEKACERGLYAKTYGWKLAGCALVRWAVTRMSSLESYHEWKNRVGFIPYAGGFTRLRLMRDAG
jgi:hypothetical protein